MAKKFYESPEFQKLQAEWYKKLAEDDFDDIETPDGSLKRDRAKRRDLLRYQNRESVEAYFDAARDKFHRGEFDSKRDKRIWELHCMDALSNVEIGKVMDLSNQYISVLIRRYQERFRLVDRWKKSKTS